MNLIFLQFSIYFLDHSNWLCCCGLPGPHLLNGAKSIEIIIIINNNNNIRDRLKVTISVETYEMSNNFVS